MLCWASKAFAPDRARRRWFLLLNSLVWWWQFHRFNQQRLVSPIETDLSDSFTFVTAAQTGRGGTLLAKCGSSGEWTRGCKVFHIEDGQRSLCRSLPTVAIVPVANGL